METSFAVTTARFKSGEGTGVFSLGAVLDKTERKQTNHGRRQNFKRVSKRPRPGACKDSTTVAPLSDKTKQNTFLRRMPRDQVVSLMSDFLEPRDTAKMEMAVSDKTGRKLLKEIFASGDVCIGKGTTSASGKEKVLRPKALAWLSLRGLKVRNLNVGSSFLDASTVSCLMTVGKNSSRDLQSLSMNLVSSSSSPAFTAQHMAELGLYCPRVTALTLRGCSTGSGSVVIEAANTMKALKSISVTGFGDACDVDDAALAKVADKCKDLTSLEIAWCPAITNDGLKCLSQSLSRVSTFRIDFCEKVSDDGLKSFVVNSRNLKSLYLEFCNNLTDACMTYILSNCPSLASISIKGCPLLSGNTIIQIADNCPSLQSVEVGGINLVTENALIHLTSKRGSDIKSLSLLSCPQMSCPQMSDTTNSNHCPVVESIASNCKNLRTLKLNNQGNSTNKTNWATIIEKSLPSIKINPIDV